MRPRGVRSIMPICIRYGSYISSIASSSSLSAAASVPSPTGPAAIFIEQRKHQVAIDFIQSAGVDAQHLQRFLGDRPRDASGRANLREVARPAQQPIRDARCPAATARNLFRAAFVHLDV